MRFLTRLFATAILLAAAAFPALADESEIFVNSATGEAINGTDPVAYFTDGAPVYGDPGISFDYKGARFLFASEEHRDLFAGDPAKYAPQYGGYCAYAMAQGAFATSVPEAWTIRDGRLYLNFSTGVRALWLRSPDAYIADANGFWATRFK